MLCDIAGRTRETTALIMLQGKILQSEDNSVFMVLHCSLQFQIEDLDPFIVYEVGVATRTRGPVGNFSEDVVVRTAGDGESWIGYTYIHVCL